MDLIGYLVGLPVLASMNPYATAFMLGAFRHTGVVQDPILLSSPFAPFATDAWLVVFGLLAVLHSTADKVPALNHFNDALHALLKPFAGAALAFAAVEAVNVRAALPLYVIVFAVLGGGVITGLTHAARSSSRLVASKVSLGFLTPLLSVAEDMAVLGGSLLLVAAPALLGLLALIACVLAVVLVRRFIRAGRQLRSGLWRARSATMTPPR